MNKRNKNQTQSVDETFSSLLGQASPRRKAPERDEWEIREAALAEWKRITGKRRERRVLVSLAVAATVVVVLASLINISRFAETDMDLQPFANVERQIGEIIIFEPATDTWRELAESDVVLSSGQIIETGSGARLAVSWNAGGLLRMDEKTRVSLIAYDQIHLFSGRLHYDSKSLYSDRQPLVNLLIETPYGTVRHMGTQFMAELADGALAVSVREGEVAISGASMETLALAGEQVIISESGIEVRQSILPYSDEWKWAQEIAPVYELDGRSMDEFLQWISRESGFVVEYETESAKSLAEETILHGKIDLPPMKALEIMFQTADLVYELHGGIILVSTRQRSQAFGG
ncbi:MAG: FecR family protein [Gammaproteobacteria bacterium]|nr:FecR family protein [Gammaproteobacteria bacterium]